MRKNFLSMVALAGMTLLAACSSDENIPAIDNGSDSAESEITLALNSGSDGITTRAGRPVNSSAAGNQVDNVQLKLYKKTDGSTWTLQSGKFENDILTWTAGPTGEGVPGYTERKESQKVKVKDLEASATYKIVAYGYKGTGTGTDCAYTVTDDKGVFTTTALGDEGTNGANIEEIFAGSAEFATDANKKITTFVQVEMNRMVAGMLGYFHNIPVKKIHPTTNQLTAVKYVKVYTVAKSATFKFPYTEADGFNGINQSTAKTELLSYDLSALITTSTASSDYAAQVKAATTGSETFTINAVSNGDVQKVANSILAGRFIIPFSATVDQNTITVELQAGNGDVLRSWSVKANTQNGGAATSLADAFKYDIKRNYFYSIGKKLRADSTEDPDNPGTDPDTPIDLNNDNDIILILNDAWDVVYDMGLGD